MIIGRIIVREAAVLIRHVTHRTRKQRHRVRDHHPAALDQSPQMLRCRVSGGSVVDLDGDGEEDDNLNFYPEVANFLLLHCNQV